MAKTPLSPNNFLSVGIDDTDLPGGGCTTHLASLLVSELVSKKGFELLDYPLLVRLNPAIPWKTRGNASVVLRLKKSEDDLHDILDFIINFILEYQGDCKFKGTNPGVVVYYGNPWIPDLRRLYFKALNDVVAMDNVLKTLKNIDALYKGGRGVIGASAGLSALAPGDSYTYELLVYRDPEYWGSPRRVDFDSAREYDVLTGELTFTNIDYTTNTNPTTPKGPDPVLYGLRGIDPNTLLKGLDIIKPHEPIHGWCIFRTNQGTSVHESLITKPRYYMTGLFECTIRERPREIAGNHVIVKSQCNNEFVNLVFYRESYPLNRIAKGLAPGDKVKVTGSVKPRSASVYPTITVEVLYIEELVDIYHSVSPRCPRCGARMKSKGRGKGYKCPKCGYYDRNASIQKLLVFRNIVPGRYTPSPTHLAHLVRPNWFRPLVLDVFPVRLAENWCKLPG